MAKQPEQHRQTPAPLKPEYWSIGEMADYLTSGIFLNKPSATRIRQAEIDLFESGKSVDETVAFKTGALDWFRATRDEGRFNFGLPFLAKAGDPYSMLFLLADLKSVDGFLQKVAKPIFTAKDPLARPKVTWSDYKELAEKRFEKEHALSEKNHTQSQGRLLKAAKVAPGREGLEAYLAYYDELPKASQDMFHTVYTLEGDAAAAAEFMAKMEPFRPLLDEKENYKTIFNNLDIKSKKDLDRVEQILLSLHDKSFDTATLINPNIVNWWFLRKTNELLNAAQDTEDASEPLRLQPDAKLIYYSLTYSSLKFNWETQFKDLDWEPNWDINRIWGDHDHDWIKNPKRSHPSYFWQDYSKQLANALGEVPDITPAEAWISGKVLAENLARFTDIEEYDKTVKVPVAWKKVEEQVVYYNHGAPDEVATVEYAVPTNHVDHIFTFSRPNIAQVVEFIKDPDGLRKEADKMLTNSGTTS